jgi:hypothetical protein
MFLTITFIISISIISVECVLLSVCEKIFSSHSLSRGRIIILTQASSRLKGKYPYYPNVLKGQYFDRIKSDHGRF